MAMDSWLIEDDAMVASRLLCGSAAAAIPMACKFRSLPAAALLSEWSSCKGVGKAKRPAERR
ncbi:hypothetical protein D9N90_24750 [Salmonella enterica]|uniref:Uncharacterized protein n=1 Tax=Salmonella enterica TaxID=28901 RepID=A0A5T9Q1I9_SALER|nr:hypothetical protein [Salmonella enterica]EBO0847923.1 hypothetical protein [Salmonella enterica]